MPGKVPSEIKKLFDTWMRLYESNPQSRLCFTIETDGARDVDQKTVKALNYLQQEAGSRHVRVATETITYADSVVPVSPQAKGTLIRRIDFELTRTG